MLSNKLTFSLAFIVMLVFGLALMATPVDAAAKYRATWTESTGTHATPGDDPDRWLITIYIPVSTDDPLEDGSGVGPATQKFEVDDADRDDIKGLDISAPVFEVGAAAAVNENLASESTRANVWGWSYGIRVVPPTDSNLLDDVDATAVTFKITDSNYSAVTLSYADREDGVPTTAFTIPQIGVNAFAFEITKATSSFHVIVKDATARDAAAGEDPSLWDNGIRFGNLTVNGSNIYSVEANLPDLDTFFQQGGTIKVLDNGGNTPAVQVGEVHITEVMWGHDGVDLSGAPTNKHQWIEVQYTGAATTAVRLRLEFVYNAYDAGGLDEVSNIYLAKWDPKGQRGHSQYGASTGAAPVPIVSMYRSKKENGAYPGNWTKSEASTNMSGVFIGTPGAPHRLPLIGGGNPDYAKDAVPGTPLQFSEVRNDDSADNVDWIEIRNVTDAPVQLENYEISLVTGVSLKSLQGKFDAQGREVKRYGALAANKKEALEHELAVVGIDKEYDEVNNDVKRFPKWELPGNAYLLIVNKDPSETILAGGKNIEVLADSNIDDNITNKGSDVYYFVTPRLRFTNPGVPTAASAADSSLLVLRAKTDKNEHDGKTADSHIIDLAGSGRHASASVKFNTEVWPLKGWKNPGGSPNIANAGLWNFVKDGHHEWWKTEGNNNGIGYDKGVDPRLAVGTPGYPHGVVKGKAADVKGGSTQPITISEIMFDASVHAGNERWNLVQWIELYNSSMAEAVNLKDWEFIIQNSNDHVDSYVDSSFRFNDLIIHPNQTVLLVSARASSDGIADRQIYNLYTQHARVLGLANRRANLLSPAGFYLKLVDTANEVVDEAGNVTINGRQRTTADWAAMPPSEGPVRYSLVRQYGTRAEDGNGPDTPAVGTMEDGWILADLDGEGVTYYGQSGDIATPGFRTGGPLPVSLSSFRPVRDKATGEVVIRWITQSELNNAGFNILRSETKTGDFKVVNLKGIIPGHGTTSEKHVYEWTDTSAKPNVVYYYQIEDVSFEGQRTTLATTHLRGNVNAAGKLTTTWGDLKTQN